MGQGVDELRWFAAMATAPLMDLLLPLCTQLESLYVSASEISTNLFMLIPPSPKQLKIQAYNVSCACLAGPVWLLLKRA